MSHPAGRAVRHEALEIITLCLSPIVPHVAHELWQALGHSGRVIDEPWPAADEAALMQDDVEFVVQVNGKLRGRVQRARGRGRGGDPRGGAGRRARAEVRRRQGRRKR